MKSQKFSLTEANKAKAAQLLYQAIAAINTAEEARKLFQDLCSPAELQALVDRWQVVGAIKQGKPYREIYQETGVSVTTVGRVARCILLGSGGYDLIYSRVASKKPLTRKPIKPKNNPIRK